MLDATNQQPLNRLMLKTGLWMALLNGVLLNLLSFHYLAVAQPVAGLADGAYLYTFSATHFFFIALVPFLLVFLPTCMLNTRHTRRACMVGGSAAYGLYLIVLVLDSYIYNLYRFHLNSTVVEQLLGPGAGQVFELSAEIVAGAVLIISLIFGLQVALFGAAQWLAGKVAYRRQMHLALALFGLYAGCQVAHAVAAAKDVRTIVRCDRYFPLCKPLNVNSLLNRCGMHTPRKRPISLHGNHTAYPKHPITGNGGGRNIVLITLDSWTAASLDSANCPNIWNFAKRCGNFRHHYSSGNCTRNGIFGMMYGLPGTLWYDFMEQKASPALVDELVKDGYDLMLYPSASMQNPAFDKTAFVRAAGQCGPAEGSKAWERDRNLARRFVADLRARKAAGKQNALFALLFFDSLHSMILPDSTEFQPPFQPTWEYPKYLEVNNSTNPEPFYNLYRNMLRYIDGYAGEVLAELEAEGLLENTDVIITGDHGQEFNENGKNFWGHNGNFGPEQVHVPLLYYSPGKPAQTYTHWTSHFDLAATLMQEALGVTNPTDDYTIGRNMLDTTLPERTHMVCDGYNGLAITDQDGTITDLFYDGDWQITDRHLNALPERRPDKNLVEKVKRMAEGNW